MVLVVVGVLIWNFSTDFQARDTALPFSEFFAQVEQGQVDSVTLSGNEIVGALKNGDRIRTYAPPQYEGLANTLLAHAVQLTAEEATSRGDAVVLLGASAAQHRVLDLLYAPDAERR